MALIGKIRKNSWLLVVTIGLALAAFILMDMFSGDKSIFGSTQFTVGEVDGEKVDWNEFNRTEQILYGNSGGDIYSRRASLWDYYVEDALVRKEAEKLGLGISHQELMDLQFSSDRRRLSPIILQRFTDPNTRQLDLNRLTSFQQAIENNTLPAETRPFWAIQEKEIIKEGLQNKISTIVNKAVYTPNWMAEMTYANENQRIDFNYVKIPFDNIDDATVELTDGDFKSYINENKGQYTQEEETRKMDYVVFNVVPSSEDSTQLYEDMKNLLPSFAETTDDSVFVENNYGTISGAFAKKSTLPAVFADTLFEMTPGTVAGPFQDGGRYVAVKLLGRQVVPDSVRSRHILIQASNPQQYLAAQTTIDSLKNLIESGTHRFDSLAVKFSQGPSGVKGGDLGYTHLGGMVGPFNDLIFYQAKEGEVNSVITQFGVHLVEVTGKKFLTNEEGVKIATLTQNIVPSETTQKLKYDEVLDFIGQNRSLEQLISSVGENPAISIESTPPLKHNDFFIGALGGGQTSRDLIKWAFEGADGIGEVSPEIYIYQDEVDFYESKYVVTGLSNIQKPGLMALDFVRSDIEPLVRNKKKGEMIREKINGNDFAAIQSMYNDVEVDTVKSVNFVSSSVTGLGNEPQVIASAFDLDVNQLSAPIVGNNGVYVIQLANKPAAPAPTNLSEARRRASNSNRSQIISSLINALKEHADIEDYRSRFY
ncbi:MAG: SurA N-terminal domain-containing protein [Bacteroidota bacterium]